MFNITWPEPCSTPPPPPPSLLVFDTICCSLWSPLCSSGIVNVSDPFMSEPAAVSGSVFCFDPQTRRVGKLHAGVCKSPCVVWAWPLYISVMTRMGSNTIHTLILVASSLIKELLADWIYSHPRNQSHSVSVGFWAILLAGLCWINGAKARGGCGPHLVSSALEFSDSRRFLVTGWS